MHELDVRSYRPSERTAKYGKPPTHIIVLKQTITNPYQTGAVNSFGENRPIESEFGDKCQTGGQQLFALKRAETGVFTAAAGHERIL
jgi:hypothetical protein